MNHQSITSFVTATGPALIFISSFCFAGMFLIALTRRRLNHKMAFAGLLVFFVAMTIWSGSVVLRNHYGSYNDAFRYLRFIVGVVGCIAAIVFAANLGRLIFTLCLGKSRDEELQRQDDVHERNQAVKREQVIKAVGLDPLKHAAR